MSPAPTEPASDTVKEWSVDELARRTGLPVRTIREYQTVGLLPAPRREGRVGRYGAAHVRRLELIARLQRRGHSLAGIRDLLAAWRSGAVIGDVLGLDADELVQIDEPGSPLDLEQLAAVLPTLIPDHLDDLLATGVVDRCGPDRYCAPSPSLLQLTVDVVEAGLDADAVVTLLTGLRSAADTAAAAVIEAFSHVPADADQDGSTPSSPAAGASSATAWVDSPCTASAERSASPTTLPAPRSRDQLRRRSSTTPARRRRFLTTTPRPPR